MVNRALLISLFLCVSVSHAQEYEKTGEILELVSAENSSGSPNGNLGAVYVEGFSSAGSCYVAGATGVVLIRLRDNDQGKFHSSMALTAFSTGKKVQVRVDDTNKDQYGACYLKQIRLNKGF